MGAGVPYHCVFLLRKDPLWVRFFSYKAYIRSSEECRQVEDKEGLLKFLAELQKTARVYICDSLQTLYCDLPSVLPKQSVIPEQPGP